MPHSYRCRFHRLRADDEDCVDCEVDTNVLEVGQASLGSVEENRGTAVVVEELSSIFVLL
jgi:hypothetical protein